MCLFESDLHKLILPVKYKKDNGRGCFFWMDPGWGIFIVKRDEWGRVGEEKRAFDQKIDPW